MIPPPVPVPAQEIRKLYSCLDEASVSAIQLSHEFHQRLQSQSTTVKQQQSQSEIDLENQLALLENQNAALGNDLEEINLQIKTRETGTKSTHYISTLKSLRTEEANNAVLRRKCDRKKLLASTIKLCTEFLGIAIGQIQDDLITSEEVILQFSNLHPNCSHRQFLLVFSILVDFRTPFVVSRASPSFPEFAALAEEMNRSQNFISLLIKSRQLWIRHYAGV